MTILIGVWVVWWMSDNFVAWWVLAFQQFLQSNDAGKDEGKFADNQGLERDQSQDSDGEWQEGGSLKLEEHQQWEQVFLALLSDLSTSCENYSTITQLLNRVIFFSSHNFHLLQNFSLTFFEWALDIFNWVFWDLELEGVWANEACNAVNQDWINFSLASIWVVWEFDIVEWSALWLWFIVILNELDALADFEISWCLVKQLNCALLNWKWKGIKLLVNFPTLKIHKSVRRERTNW